MSQTLQYKGYEGSVEYRAEDRILRGRRQGSGAAFSVGEKEWRKTLQVCNTNSFPALTLVVAFMVISVVF